MNYCYMVEPISSEEKNQYLFSIYKTPLYEKKSEIHGTCIKFFTDNESFKDLWDENFKPIDENIRPHARLFAITDKTKQFRIFYEPISKTVIIKNCDYYGWVKSIALGLVADFFEDFISEHRRYSIHGSFVDKSGRGIALIGPSGSGKTTLTYGLLLDRTNNFITDDWFFVRLTETDALVYGSEKNSYIRDDLAESWPPFKEKLKDIRKDNKGRSIVDVKRLFGESRIRSNSVLRNIVLLMRDKTQPVFQKVSAQKALSFMLDQDFCNPHQLIRSKQKLAQRKAFFLELFSRIPVYLLNTIETPKESLERLKKLIKD